MLQVKNVSGRLLVGLRWWNEVSENGGSEWRFETLQEGQRAVDKKDSFIFWTVLYAMPALWVLLGVVAVLKFNFDYLLLVVIAVLLNTANLTGYLKCSKAAQAQIKGMASGLFASGLRVRRGWAVLQLHVRMLGSTGMAVLWRDSAVVGCGLDKRLEFLAWS